MGKAGPNDAAWKTHPTSRRSYRICTPNARAADPSGMRENGNASMCVGWMHMPVWLRVTVRGVAYAAFAFCGPMRRLQSGYSPGLWAGACFLIWPLIWPCRVFARGCGSRIPLHRTPQVPPKFRTCPLMPVDMPPIRALGGARRLIPQTHRAFAYPPGTGTSLGGCSNQAHFLHTKPMQAEPYTGPALTGPHAYHPLCPYVTIPKHTSPFSTTKQKDK